MNFLDAWSLYEHVKEQGLGDPLFRVPALCGLNSSAVGPEGGLEGGVE